MSLFLCHSEFNFYNTVPLIVIYYMFRPFFHHQVDFVATYMKNNTEVGPPIHS
jgi:hypothetical protein